MKKIFTKSEKINENYATKIIRIDNINPHPNPEVTRLDITTVFGSDVIVGRGSIKVGDIVVYCPSESALNVGFLRVNNQFRDAEMNIDRDKNKCGFFENKGRVKAINLKGLISTGFIFPLEWLQVWQPNLNLQNIEDYINEPFDTVNGELFSKKYVIRQLRQSGSGMGNSKNLKRNNKLQRFDKMVENQFSFHYDTHRLTDRAFTIDPNDVISITSKFHGTSLIVGHVLVNKKLGWFEKLLKRFNIDIQTKIYDYLYSSRGVIKNRYVNKDVGSGYYNVDIWTAAGEKLKPFIVNGLTIYAEIVGYLPGSGKYIQKNHDYKCNVGEYEIYIYRITYTNVSGDTFEFSAKQVQKWCKSWKNDDPTIWTPKAVKELYYGQARYVYPELPLDEHWHRNFVEMLSKDKDRFFMELSSPDCNNDVPHEGIVVRNDSTGGNALKLKTKAHFLMESKELDSGEADIESMEEARDFYHDDDVVYDAVNNTVRYEENGE